MPEIRLTDIRKTFPNGAVGLHETALHIPTGCYFVLLGPSGSGKTTLLRLIAGLEMADSGTIYFDEQPVHQLPPNQRGIVFIPQRSALYPNRDVRGNIRAGIEFEQSRKPRKERIENKVIDDRVAIAAELLGIHKLLSNRPHELSGGEQRRVMLARAIVRQAPIWLLDEPLSQLDSPLADKLSRDLHLIQKQFGHTIIHVTHDPIEAMALADRVGLLGGGRILQTGHPDEVYARPSSRTVGFHFGRPSMNFLEGRSDGTTFATEGWLSVPCRHDGEVTLGIRPEDVGCLPAEGFIRVGEGEIAEAQRLDSRLLIGVRGPKGVQVHGIGNELPTGRVSIYLRRSRLHWFESRTGERLMDTEDL
jgi:ABC-type sugar transport system ATPase subunit